MGKFLSGTALGLLGGVAVGYLSACTLLVVLAMDGDKVKRSINYTDGSKTHKTGTIFEGKRFAFILYDKGAENANTESDENMSTDEEDS